jgi:hypothetical protein
MVAIPDTLRDSVSRLEVVARCECGCDTIEFRGIDWSNPPGVLAEGVAVTPDGKTIGLIVFGTSERATCLEVYSFDDEPDRLPTLDSIQGFGSREA